MSSNSCMIMFLEEVEHFFDSYSDLNTLFGQFVCTLLLP